MQLLILDDLKHLGFGEDLLERFVVDEAGPVLGDIQLPLLKMFTEFPECHDTRSGSLI